ARGFARPQEEMRQGISAILEGAGLARGCGNGHCDIITMASRDTQRILMRCLAVLLCFAAISLRAQTPVSDSTRAESTPPPLPPVTQVDSLIKYTTTCEDSAVVTPGPTVLGLGKRMKSYDAALRDFRVAIGLPVKEDTAKTTRRP